MAEIYTTTVLLQLLKIQRGHGLGALYTVGFYQLDTHLNSYSCSEELKRAAHKLGRSDIDVMASTIDAGLWDIPLFDPET